LKGNLCWLCAQVEGYLLSVDPNALLAKSYQLEKFIKHHATPTWVTGVNSLFSDPATVTYANYVTTTVASGSVAVDNSGKPSFIWYAAKTVGFTYVNGVYRCPSDAVRVVLPNEATRIHAYPVPAGDYAAVRCANCDKPILAGMFLI
jgi:hypothetical protein